jgi:YidC/Oxa1 family membrane protein insertase
MAWVAAFVLPLVVAPASGEELTIVAGASEIVFDAAAGTPRRWILCAPDCMSAEARRTVFMDADDGYFRVETPHGPGGAFSAIVEESATDVTVRFSAADESYLYRLSRTRPELRVELPARASVQLASSAAFIPEQLPGFGQIYSRVTPVQVGAIGQRKFEELDGDPLQISAGTDVWTGIRNRYWTVVLQPEERSMGASVGVVGVDRPVITVSSSADASPVILRLYAGPVEWQSLRSVDPVLSEMLFAAIWDFLRMLCFGMLLLLDFLYGIVGHYGVAIILLSLSVKVLMYPLTVTADRWQADVNRIHTQLKPDLDEIKRLYKGEDAHQRTLQVYKKHDVSPLFTFKSAAGFLIQIPVFIAAFDMLAENFALNSVSFFWISDLAKPDQLAALPFVLPFFGGYLNLLPFLMTGLSSLAAWLQAEKTLSADLQRQQSLRLYLMSVAFFVLFYTFPAGMVLYWTSSNLFHLLKVEAGRSLR